MSPATLYKPIIFRASDRHRFETFQINYPHLTIVDHYLDQLHELFKSRYPKLARDSVKEMVYLKKLFQAEMLESTGNWVFYPWNHTLVHVLDETLYQEVRLSRNYPLIKKSDQQKFFNLTIGIVGLSVGSSIIQTIVHSGGCNQIKLADFDTLSLSNLNRIRASVVNLGENKTHIAAKQIYEINPYARISLYEDGLNPANLKDFMLGNPKLDVVIDAADDLTAKQYLRLAAQSLRVPLVMTTDNGFESNTSILRFDKNKNAGGMRGMPEQSIDDIQKAYESHKPLQLTEKQKLKLIAKLVGVKNISHEMQHGSMLRAKGQIAGWPQLAMTVFMGGSLAAYAVKLIAVGAKTYQKQSSFSIPAHLRPQYNGAVAKKTRQKHTRKFLEFLNSIKN
jgi:tRNA threonylcarbamoyladenosine dehydratase